jgi:hypothetical protein
MAVFGAAATGALAELLSRGPALAEALLRFFAADTLPKTDGQLDDDGFRHFSGTPPGAGKARAPETFRDQARSALAQAPEFFQGLSEAIHKDLSASAQRAAEV